MSEYANFTPSDAAVEASAKAAWELAQTRGEEWMPDKTWEWAKKAEPEWCKDLLGIARHTLIAAYLVDFHD